jgi:hypothetical protein
LLALIDLGLGHRIVFPNPFPGEIGLASSRGIISYRAIQAIYQAWRVYNLVKGNRDARIVEVGAGLGRTAFYAATFGLHNYTIVDLPLSSVAQGYFLGRTLGPDAICLYKEQRSGIAILPPSKFLNSDDRYDVLLNADSLTELDPRRRLPIAKPFVVEPIFFFPSITRSIRSSCMKFTGQQRDPR